MWHIQARFSWQPPCLSSTQRNLSKSQGLPLLQPESVITMIPVTTANHRTRTLGQVSYTVNLIFPNLQIKYY